METMNASMSFCATTSLDGLWDFCFLGEVDISDFSPTGEFLWEKTLVPSAFDALPARAGQRGAALYRRMLNIEPGTRARIEFGAVSMWCRIYVDGVPLREHACGYAPFAVDLAASESPRRELLVLVDNRYDFDRMPMHEEYFDFYQYGGILRSVYLRELPRDGVVLEGVQVLPLAEGYDRGEVEVVLHLSGELPEVLRGSLAFDESGPEIFEAEVSGGKARLRCRVPDAKVWSPESPHLHSVAVAIGGSNKEPGVVCGRARFGLRRIEARDGALWLNGERLILRGYNRHEWHPNSGPCTPTLQMYADLLQLKDLGCNFVRGSHYPQDQRFLDLCDELGMLVWEENLGWGQKEKTFASAKFRRDHLESLTAMVRASWNHPSVIIWGFLNEAQTDRDEVRPVLEESVETLRALDSTRLVSYATMFALTDKHYDLIDLIALNIYPGWYSSQGVRHPLELIAPRYEKCFAHLDAQGWAAKPVIISETGAEALYGWRDAHQDFYTEQYQAAYLETSCRAALDHPRCSGIALWHFSDVRTYSGGWAMSRPRTFNNKGTLDEYRRPKLAYETVKTCFREFAARAL